MNRADAKTRIEKLKVLIDKYRYDYHVLDKADVSDAVNDSLKHELQALENQFPEFVTPDSPTQRVGGKPLDKFTKVTHSQPMLSLVDAFEAQEVEDWQTRNQKIVDNMVKPSIVESCPSMAETGYFAELKIDGLAMSLIYDKGKFVRGATRGDGKIGEDVTQNLKTIDAIPLKLKTTTQNSKLPKRIEIRGEAYMPKAVFEELNKKYKKEGKAILANPRNAAAGSIRQLDSRITLERKLSFIAWDLLGVETKTHKESHEILKELGFKTVKENHHCRNLDEVEKLKIKIENEREKLPFLIDGLVILLNDNHLREKLGVVGKAPRGMLAYKFAPVEATSVVEDIIIQVGRMGTLTPVAVLKPVLVAGSVVSRATLHNEDEIRKKDIRVHDTVIIHKAGDVIPEIEKVIKELRPKNIEEFHFPKKCPVCGGRVAREKGKAAYRCLNKNCFVVQQKRLEHFVSKLSFDMAGLGPKILNKFIDEGLIKDAADLFNLTEGDIKHLERFAEKSAQNIINSIRTHKKIELAKFIYALGIPNIGEETAHDIANIVNQKVKIRNQKQILNLLKSKKLDDWQDIPDIGPIVAQSIYNYFQDKKSIDFIERLFKAGIKIKFVLKSDKKFVGLSFVFTGSLETLSRDEAKEKVHAMGGEISELVSHETNYVVAGSEPGKKYDKAQKLGVKIISEKEFLDLIKK